MPCPQHLYVIISKTIPLCNTREATLGIDLGVTLVCQSDPTWYKSDPKSTSSRLEATWAKNNRLSTSSRLRIDLHGTLLFTFVYYDSIVRSYTASIRVSVVIRQNFHLRVTSQICNLMTLWSNSI